MISLVLWWTIGVLVAWLWAARLHDAWTGMPRVSDISLPTWDTAPKPTPRLAIIIPARNEEPHVREALISALQLDYGDYEVLAIDDRSTDRTGEIMDDVFARHANGRVHLRVIHISDLPDGWLGKPHAMWLAAKQVRLGTDWLLFTDADVIFRADALRRALAYAEAERADHLIVFPTYKLQGIGEKVMMGGFQMLFVFGHRLWKVEDPKSKDFMGLGPFNLIRRSAYETVGTFRTLRLEVVEDLKLGKLVKQHGLRQRNVFGPGLLSWRWGNGALGLVRNLTKNSFALLEFRWPKALGACLLWLAFNLLPIIGLLR